MSLRRPSGARCLVALPYAVAMLLSQPAIDAIRERIVALGINRCPVCDSGTTIGVDYRPVVVPVGGPSWAGGDVDQHADLLYMVRLECDLCGLNLFFNVEKFYTGDAPAFRPS
jgi:hypothetical protein